MTYIHIPDGRINVNGTPHMHDSQGNLRPVQLIKASDLLEDETVRGIMMHGIRLGQHL